MAINSIAPGKNTHDRMDDKDCVFHFKREKADILLSINSGKICDSCSDEIKDGLTDSIDEALRKMFRIVSNQHSFSLILKGGGVRGLAFVGALTVLEKYFSFDTFVGTSAGAVAAVLLAAGYNSKELLVIFKEKDFREFKDTNCFFGCFNFLTRKGFFPGNDIERWINNLLRRKVETSDGVVRMEDLPQHAVIYACGAKSGTISFDSRKHRKEFSAAFSVRCSMSIPLYFIPKKIGNERIYDGGMRNNFPFKKYLDDNANELAIGLYLKSNYDKKKNFLDELIDVGVEGDDSDVIKENSDKIVLINTGTISSTDFDLTDRQKKYLVASGKAGAWKFIKDNFPDVEIDEADFALAKQQMVQFHT